jgi:hypothetical protein
MTLPEAAEAILNIDPNTLRKRYQRLLQRIRNLAGALEEIKGLISGSAAQRREEKTKFSCPIAVPARFVISGDS